MKTQKGLTLVELMITMAVMIVMLAFGVPLYQNMQSNNRITAQANQLVTAMQLGRSEAVRRSAVVTVCAKSSTDETNTTCGVAADWRKGIQVFVDNDGDGVFDTSAPADLRLRVFGPLSGSPTVTASAAAIQFSNIGENVAGAATIELSQAGATVNNRCLRVSAAGQVRVHQVTVSQTCP